jgi:hypothetical protein
MLGARARARSEPDRHIPFFFQSKRELQNLPLQLV